MTLDEFAPDLSRASTVGRLALDLWMTPLSSSDLPRPQGKDLCCLYLLDYSSQDFLNDVQLSSFALPYHITSSSVKNIMAFSKEDHPKLTKQDMILLGFQFLTTY